MEREEHLVTIREVKRYINKKDFEGLKNYIENREIEVSNNDNNISGDYMDKLVKDLA